MSGPKEEVIRPAIKKRAIFDRGQRCGPRGQVYQCILETSWPLKKALHAKGRMPSRFRPVLVGCFFFYYFSSSSSSLFSLFLVGAPPAPPVRRLLARSVLAGSFDGAQHRTALPEICRAL